MIAVSIISACNNNCEYCFQKDSYHKQNTIIELAEFREILTWSTGADSIGILGGEPTLHPDCVQFCKEASNNFNTMLYTNLLCSPHKVQELLKISSLNWLINTTTNDASKELFENNIKIINKHGKSAPFAIGLTLTGDIEYDYKHIVNIANIAKKYHNVSQKIRVGLATPCHDKVFTLKSYDKSALMLYEVLKKEAVHSKIVWDCCVNGCQLSKETMHKIYTDIRTISMDFHCLPLMIEQYARRLDILSDRSVNICSSTPSELLNIDDYRKFPNWLECAKYIKKACFDYLNEYNYYCKVCNKCKDNVCPGACLASIANLVKQDKKANGLISKYRKFKYEKFKYNKPIT